MYIRSEITGKNYKTVEDCLADEKEFECRKEEEEAKKREYERMKEEKEKEQEKIEEEAVKDLAKAVKKYCKLTNSTLHDVAALLLRAVMVGELEGLVK